MSSLLAIASLLVEISLNELKNRSSNFNAIVLYVSFRRHFVILLFCGFILYGWIKFANHSTIMNKELKKGIKNSADQEVESIILGAPRHPNHKFAKSVGME